MKTAFVTGGTGFVGLNVVAELVSRGWHVVALHRPTSRTEELLRLGVRLAPGDLSDPASLRAALPEDADAVFHVAGNTALWRRADAEQTRDNVDGTRNMLEAALARRARRFVHTSSTAAYGQHGCRITEDTPSVADRSPINYFRTKRAGERLVEEAAARGLAAVILNPANIVGPHDRTGWARAVRLIAEGKFPAIPPGRNSFAHVREVARAHVAAAERGRPGEHYLLGCVEASYAELIRTIGEVAGCAVPRLTAPAVLLRGVARVNALRAMFTGREPDVSPEGVAILVDTTTCSSEKAQRELGYRPSTLREMVEDCWTWLLAEGLVQKRAA